MKIWEIERETGLDRGNIRFYEKEGLLQPERHENGYREYSEEDLQTLLRIKLMRRLGFSLDSIRSLQQGSADMEQVLSHRLAAIEQEKQQLDATRQVCLEMRQEGAAFSSLDAKRYLNSYDRALNVTGSASIKPNVPASDRIKPPRIPWRRFFARSFDLSIAQLVIYAILCLCFRLNITQTANLVDWLLGYLAWALLLPLEALCISRFGTTPGKALMGISITDAYERPLSFGDAAMRTWEMFGRGQGYHLPIYSVYRNWKSYKEVKNGEELEWDQQLTVTAKEYRHWRTVVYIAATALLMGLLVLVGLSPNMPSNRGDDLTVEEFVENYNQLSKFHNQAGAGTLLPDGTLMQKSLFVVNGVQSTEKDDKIRMQFYTEDGKLEAISYEYTDENMLSYIADSRGKQVIQNAAMAWAWSDTNLISAMKSTTVLDDFLSHREGTMEREVLGYRLTYTITPSGETHEAGGVTYWADKYEITFMMTEIK